MHTMNKKNNGMKMAVTQRVENTTMEKGIKERMDWKEKRIEAREM